MLITLPWPDKRLSPNARVHWADKGRAAATARNTAHWLVVNAKALRVNADAFRLKTEAVRASITFHPPDKRPRDLDNMLASCKAYLDGISEAISIDDSKWEIAMRKAEVRKGGAVVVELEFIND